MLASTTLLSAGASGGFVLTRPVLLPATGGLLVMETYGPTLFGPSSRGASLPFCAPRFVDMPLSCKWIRASVTGGPKMAMKRRTRSLSEEGWLAVILPPRG
eukprot:508060-Alexandrium_andersonii.AAC.1